VVNAEQRAPAGAVAEPAEAPSPPVDLDLNPRVFMCEPDGSNMKPLLDLPEYTVQGTPSWSSDGRRIALEAWRSALEETNDDSKIVVVNADGSQPRILATVECQVSRRVETASSSGAWTPTRASG